MSNKEKEIKKIIKDYQLEIVSHFYDISHYTKKNDLIYIKNVLKNFLNDILAV